MATKSTMLFDVLANILKHKSIDEYKKHIRSEFFKDASGFMVRRYLTMHTNSRIRDIVVKNYLALERMPDNVQYLWLLKNIPYSPNTFIKYIR